MKKKTEAPSTLRRFSFDGVDGAASKNGAPRRLRAFPVFKHPKTQLEAAIQRYVDLFDFAPIGYVTFDRVGRIEEVNLTATRLLRRNRQHLLGAPFALCVAKEDAELFLHHLLRCRLSDGNVETELRLRTPTGEIFPVLLSSTPTSSWMKDGALFYQTTMVDLTDRRRAEDELRASEELHRALVSQTAAGIGRYDLNGRYHFVNAKYCEMLGYQESELVGKLFHDVTYPGDLEENVRLFKRLAKTGEPFELEKRLIRKDGSIIWTIVSMSPIRHAGGKVHSTASVILDISQRKKAEAALQEGKLLLETRVKERTADLIAANKDLQNEIVERKRLEGELLGISDREQRRIGQELHDSLCQHLTAVAFMARSVAIRLKNHRVMEVRDIEKIAELINAGVTEARAVARGLHPVEMDSAGLVAAIYALGRQSTLPIRFDVDEELRISDPNTALHLYRIAREAVINANRHAGAREIIVRMRVSSKELALSVSDDGTGVSSDMKRGAGMGLHIMEYRARSIGGRLKIDQVRPHGTSVLCYLPRQ